MSGVMSAIGLDAAGTAAAAGAADATAGAVGAAGTDALASAAAPSLMDIVGSGVAGDAGMADSMAAPSLWGSLTSGIGSGLGSLGSGLDSVGSGISSLFDSGASGAPGVGATTNPLSAGTQDFLNQLGPEQISPQLAAQDPSLVQSGAGAVSGSGNSGGSGGLMNWLGTGNHAAIAAGVGLPALQGIAQQFTLPKYNVQKNANQVMASSPNFNNPNLPSYSMQNTATPYSGNWYNYGYTPQPAMYNAMPVPTGSKTGGLIGYAHGGQVRKYAMGGGVNPLMPQGTPPVPQQGMPPQNPMAMAPQRPPMPPQGAMPPQRKPVNPLMLKAAHEVGVAIGEHIKKKRMTPSGPVRGAGGGQDDVIPARLSDGEYVHSADVVAALGDGSSKEGGKKLQAMDAAVRAHKTSKGSGFPPKAKNPLAYIPKKVKA